MTGSSPGMPDSPPTGAWDAYWHSPRLAACLRNEKGNYGGVIGDTWREWFGRLPRGARLLDVATGNGAVALLALEHSDRTGLDWDITATDAARIDPPAALPQLAEPLRRIRFLGETPAEALPFEDDHFHALTGQYAIEYTDMPRTLTEAARVLQPEGRLMFITHRKDSTVYRETERQLELVRALMDLRLAPRVEALLTAAEGSPEAERARARFDDGAAKAVGLLRRSDGQGRTFLSQYLERLGALYQSRRETGIDGALRALGELDADVRAHRDRLRALRAAALSREGVRRTRALLERSGFRRVRTRRLRQQGEERPLGQCFEGVLKAPQA